MRSSSAGSRRAAGRVVSSLMPCLVPPPGATRPAPRPAARAERMVDAVEHAVHERAASCSLKARPVRWPRRTTRRGVSRPVTGTCNRQGRISRSTTAIRSSASGSRAPRSGRRSPPSAPPCPPPGLPRSRLAGLRHLGAILVDLPWRASAASAPRATSTGRASAARACRAGDGVRSSRRHAPPGAGARGAGWPSRPPPSPPPSPCSRAGTAAPAPARPSSWSARRSSSARPSRRRRQDRVRPPRRCTRSAGLAADEAPSRRRRRTAGRAARRARLGHLVRAGTATTSTASAGPGRGQRPRAPASRQSGRVVEPRHDDGDPPQPARVGGALDGMRYRPLKLGLRFSRKAAVLPARLGRERQPEQRGFHEAPFGETSSRGRA